MLHQQSPQLLILDYWLPDSDGLSMSQRAREAGYDGPILFVTALTKGDAEYEVLTRTFGAQCLVLKPFAPGELIARVEQLLRMERSL
jgi:DNA-binding response OmpR family regulator